MDGKILSQNHSLPELEKAINYIYWFVAVLLLFSFAAPLLAKLNASEGNIAYRILHFFCHQQPSRCWMLFDHKMGLCVRCCSMLLAIIIAKACSLYSRQRYAIVILLTPMLMDGGTQLLGMRESTALLRCITGTLAGIALHLYLQQFHREYVRWR
jgi:uncharacterized membrane protein